MTSQKQISPHDLCELIRLHLEEKKAEKIMLLNLVGKSAIADYMMIATGSRRQIASIADSLYRLLKDHGLRSNIEGLQSCDWVLIDALDVVVHLFNPETRSLYNLEKMWDWEMPETTKASPQPQSV